MANKYAGTKTEKNLMEAFAGESQARNKYTYFASVAKKAGFEAIFVPAENAAEAIAPTNTTDAFVAGAYSIARASH